MYLIQSRQNIEECYRQFKEVNDRQTLLTGLYSKTREYCLIHLNSDHDIVGDFLLDFIEHRLDKVLAEFERRKHPYFTAFYLLYVRNLFRNFIRRYRRRELNTLPLQVDVSITEPTQYFMFTDNSRNQKKKQAFRKFWSSLRIALANHNPIDAVLFKFYYSIPLNIQDIKFLVNQFGADKTEYIIYQIEKRRSYRQVRMQVAEDRINRYYRRASQGQIRRSSERHQADILAYKNRFWNNSIYSLAKLLNLNRQNAAFRLKRTTARLQKELHDCKSTLQFFTGDIS
ncbi:MAG: hypothetical protein H3C43_03575 [Leptonema sp. (in: Bacteria)]|nr:hypothetical protein [Leptonema sp. (in: bacteria)]